MPVWAGSGCILDATGSDSILRSKLGASRVEVRVGQTQARGPRRLPSITSLSRPHPALVPPPAAQVSTCYWFLMAAAAATKPVVQCKKE